MSKQRLLPAALVAVSLAWSAVTPAAVETRTLNNGNLVMEDIPPVPDQVADDLNRYQSVRSASVLGWTEEGDALYVSTRFGEVNQIHRVDRPGGARQQLTFFTEPVGQVEPRPQSRQIAFTMDAGGSEDAQIFLFDPATGDSRMLTDGESRNGQIAWSPDGSLVAYQSTRRNGRANDIWITRLSADGHTSTLALESPDGSWWGPVSFSADNSRLLVQQYISSTNSLVHVLDLESGELQRVAGDSENQSRNYAGDFDSDGSGIFYVSDQRGEFAQLVHRNLATGEERVITDGIAWDVSSVVLSDDRRRGAFTINENGMDQVYLFNPRNMRYRKVKDLPIGVVGGLTFNGQGDKLALSINTPKTPTDTFVLNLRRTPLRHAELERWTKSEVGGLDTDSFIEPELVHYPTFDTVDGEARKIPAFVYRPRDTEGPVPVVISIHGGPEAQYRPYFSSTYQLWLQKLGVAVIAPNVRGSAGYGKTYVALDNGYKREDSVRDIGALLDWIDTQPDLDGDRVAVFGGSYGGYMVLASAMHYSDRLRAAVDIVGISNFVTFLTNTRDYRRDLRRVEYGNERDPDMRAFLERISPSNNVDKIRVPMLVVQGENDPRVPVTEAEQIVAALREGGKPVWYMNALNEGHGYRKKENRDVFSQVTALFFSQHLLEKPVSRWKMRENDTVQSAEQAL
ncbi:Prolyl endopeptidase [Microbulbifer aggregans]|uniref:Prolyl endopeptidase n=1 Tax=Microbulbifer aggregans TaxID=1769779 RepID=A0A1C9W608_9GAMM|nr:S9 family peptidase [Microbulbifer aggregans]AOS96578.1 Prolyl endopeptidase [Microbulbifer aggregans]